MKNLITSLAFALAFHVAAQATPVTYQINFVATSGPAPDSGSFTYDPAVGFSNFSLQWLGATLTPSPSANTPILNIVGCDNEASTPAFGFIIMSKSATGCSATYVWNAQRNGGDGGISVLTFELHTPAKVFGDLIEAGALVSPGLPLVSASGTWTIAAAAPEPASYLLVLAGIFVIWRGRSSWASRIS